MFREKALIRAAIILVAAIGFSHAAVIDNKRADPTPCSQVTVPDIPGTEILSFTASERRNISGPYNDGTTANFPILTNLDVCEIKLQLTHPGVNDNVTYQVWFPLDIPWNERFIATGGGGYAAGGLDTLGLGLPVMQGFAAGVTDGGNIALPNGALSETVLNDAGQLDYGKLASWSFSSLHELAVIGKAATSSYYGQEAKYSYFSGCSTGGRQGYSIVQRYPNDFDGVLSIAPAISFPALAVALGLAQVVERGLQHEVPDCVANGISNAAVEACDALDGVVDKIISNVGECRFDVGSLIGTEVACGNETAFVTQDDADVISAIMDGARTSDGQQLYPGGTWGTNYTTLTSYESALRPVYDSWTQIIINKDASFNLDNYTTVNQLVDFVAVSQATMDGFVGANSPELTAFRDSGGKHLTWHGLADEVVFHKSSIQYRQMLEAVFGGGSHVDEFSRLFLAPGIGHCFGGPGAIPADALDTLIRWVEEGDAPEVLHGTTAAGGERLMCRYPLVARYDGQGNPDDSSSYECAEDFGEAANL